MATIAGLWVDIDGVLTVSWEVLPGIPEAFARLRSRGIPMRLATNTTTRARSEIARLLGELGIDVDAGEILTAPAATAVFLRREYPKARCLLINEGDLSDDLAGIDLVDEGPIDVVLVGGAGPTFAYEVVNRAFRELGAGAALVVMHRNLSWRTSAGMQLDSGAFITGLEAATGVEATVVGKPSPAFFASALEALGLPADQVAMVGDDVVSDVLAAQAAGMTGILVRTGKVHSESLHDMSDQPDVVLESFREVPYWLEGVGA
jgi:HAD superfamily hydrolase (TIGR01458 family)